VSPDFPTTAKAYDRRYNRREDAFVAKLNAQGSKLAYSTYLGGNAFDKAQGIAVDKRGEAYVTGWTTSPNFPTSRGAFAKHHKGGEDGFVTKLDAQGSKLVYSTYLGGRSNDRGRGIAVDASGTAYVGGATSSPDFPATRGALATAHIGGEDAFVTKLNAKGSRLLYSSYLGGTAQDFARAIAIDARGNVYLTGRTASPDFPATALYTSLRGELDAFVTKLHL
jgi:hypothetical protein